MGDPTSSSLSVPRWLAVFLAIAVAWIVLLDSISTLLWTPAQVRALLAWREEMPSAEEIEDLEVRVKALETELRISHERYMDLLNRRSD